MEKLPENLRALIYCRQHSSYPEVISEYLPGLVVDTEKKTWSYANHGTRTNNQPPKKIGEYNYFAKENSFGVIGVYDITNDNHLTSMVRDWQTTQENKNRNWNNYDD